MKKKGLITLNNPQLICTVSFGALIILLLSFSACNTNGLIEKSGGDDQIRYGEYIVENNIWNIQAAKSKWAQTVFFDTINGSMGWRWDFSSEPNQIDSFIPKTYPQIIFGKKPYKKYQTTTTAKLPIELPSAKFSIEYEYSAKATGVYNTSTDITFTDSKNPVESNIMAKLMIWIDCQDMPFFKSKEFTQATIGGIHYKVMVDKEHNWTDGKWIAIAMLAEKFPSSGIMDLTEYINYFLSQGALKPEWYLSSIEIGSEVSSGKGEARFKKFIVHN